MSGEAVAGSIIGFLRLDADSFFRTIEEAQAAADKLDTKKVDVKVKADTGVAEAKLAAVAASEDKVDKGNVKVAKSGQQAGQGMGALLAAVITLGPALVPLAAGTVGLAAGFGAMGVAGILAVVGIMQEMKAGTTLGASYTAMLGTLKGDLTTLGHTAAAGVLRPFQTSVADLQTRMPALNSIIGEFSGITGRTAGVLTTGLVAGFMAFAPLARDAGVYVLTLSQRFAAMMSGPGVVTFGDYVRSVFPQVMQAVESIVGAALRLVAALAPLGMGTLTILRTFTDLINALPVDVLANLATVAGSVAIGFSIFKMLSVDMAGFGTALQKVGISAETAATGVRALNIAAGVIGAILTVATLLYTANAEATRQNTQAANDYADALRTSNGIIDENIRQMTVKNLSDSGALAAARQLGISLSTVTDAALGQGVAMATITAIAKPMIDAYDQAGASTGKSTAAYAKNGQAAGDLLIALGVQNTALRSGTQTWKDQAAATATSTATATPAIAAQQALAAKLGITVPALLAAEDAQKKTADAAAGATYKMYAENDAAGILKMGLDLLNGKAISAAQAQNAFDSSLSNMGTHVTTTGKKVEFTTASILNMSTASVALRGQLIGQVTNLQTVIEANGGLANSTGAARAQMVTMRQQIIDNAVAHGVNRAAVTAYVDKLLSIPKSVPPTKLDVEKTAAEAKLEAFRVASVAATQNRAMAVRADIGDAMTAIQRLLNTIPAQRTITLYLAAGASTPQALNYMNAINKRANGGITPNAMGSITAYAGGGENHVAQIAPAGAMRLWAEPETGGEAYIPLAPSKRPRSTAIWEETGKRLGVGGGSGGPTSVQVFIGDRELTDIVRVTVDGHTQQLTDALVYGGH